MSRACKRAEQLLDQRRAGLDEPERLVLEQHLSGCPACARLSAHLYAVTTVFDTLPQSLPEPRRERLLDAAFAAAAVPRVAAPVRNARVRVYGVIALAAAAALALVPGWLHTAGGERMALPTPPVAAPASTPAKAAPAPTPDAPAWIRATGAEELAFAHARVRADADTELRFLGAESTLELGQGHVHVQVDPRPGLPFRVRTAGFVVEVLGTVFDVSAEAVEVEHGHVQVHGPGGELLADLRDHQRYTPSARARAVLSQASVRQLLTRARTALARGDVAAARGLAARADEGAQRRADRAEAATLRAECALVERDLKGAERAYLAVSRAYPELPAGENALFAAAKLARRAGDASAAQALFARYLARYPNGRFVAEARR